MINKRFVSYTRKYVHFSKRPDIKYMICVHEQCIYVNVDASLSASVILLEVVPRQCQLFSSR